MDIQACPSCAGKIQKVANGKFYCEACDVIFRITREGPKVETVAPLNALTQRVTDIEQQIGKPESSEDPTPAPGCPPSEEPAEDLDEDLGDEDPGDDDDDDPIFPE